ncbi:50S ribosomal protein L24 [Opitutales bacterium]|jgi:large subunit ribosomal protein L24|nr:50S ribosomal protein L24 [Opitutales bacterium]|tara:strand:- start:447 stop:683 length:237 start_codon:yes stop_codon:yes gene_type:complete
MATKIKKGDEVVVTAGDHKGSKGKILQVLREKNRVIVEGVNMIKKHEKKSQDNPQGSIVEREASIHFSNVRKSEVSSN